MPSPNNPSNGWKAQFSLCTLMLHVSKALNDFVTCSSRKDLLRHIVLGLKTFCLRLTPYFAAADPSNKTQKDSQPKRSYNYC